MSELLYFIYNVLNGHVRKFLFTPKDAVKVPAMILYYLHLRRESPQQGDYNPLQKLAYSSVFFMLTPLVLLTGLAMSPQLDLAFHWLPAAFGGRQSARSIHFILAFAFALFTFGHIFMVLTTGFINNMRSMVTGWYREKVPPHVEIPEASAVPPAEPIALNPPLPVADEGKGETKTDDDKPLTADRESAIETQVPETSAESGEEPKDKGKADEESKS